MTVLIAIFSFLVAIGVLVTFHELGHYWVARLCDVRILRFSVGFGRPVWLRRRGPDATEWVIGVFPLGGYVKMADERDGSAVAGDEARAFNRKSVWQRSAIVAAGPIANFILAALFYWVLFVSGVPDIKPLVAEPVPGSLAAQAGFEERDLILQIAGNPVRTWGEARLALIGHAAAHEIVEIEVETVAGWHQSRRLDLSGISKDDLDQDILGRLDVTPYRPPSAVIKEVARGTPADRAGLQGGDRVLSIDGVKVTSWVGLMKATAARPGKLLTMQVERRGSQFEVSITPDSVEQNGKTVGRLGVIGPVPQPPSPLMHVVIRYGPLEAIPRAWGKVYDMSWFSLKMMGRMLTGDVSLKNLSGPISIAQYAGQSAQLGWVQFLNYLALISISLGVLNLLPVPVLDGGQLMYHIAEVIKGSPVSERAMEIGQQVGLTLLLGLTAFAFYNDIHRLLSG
ncbi:MAG: RIP metalloprotease RseP [Betaproteobacteria bacterium]|nr:RIP metalloprotease RseP [Betaproteobacteria bacterium]